MGIDKMAQRKATDAEIKLALETMSAGKAAKHLGINKRTLFARKAKMARQGWSPEHDMTKEVPDGFHLKGTSTLYDENGVAKLQWVKTSIDHERQQELIAEGLKAMASELPKVEPREFYKSTDANLLAVYPIGDAHIGMYANKAESGQDWDLKSIERIQCAAMASLVESAPPTKQALIINCGDWFHADNAAGVTSRSHHSLDMSGRYFEMIHVGIKVMRQCIESALLKHETVKVFNVTGNHDDLGSCWLAVALSHTYENEPRVIIETSPAPFLYHEHGKVLIGAHHGHSCKAERLPGVMAADQAPAWGRTVYRYWYLGHVHHQSVKEYAGVTVESFNTLAAKDAYSAWGGYRAQQNMKCIVLHAEYGEVGRYTVNPDMLKSVA
jgi:hypothetical protein